MDATDEGVASAVQEVLLDGVAQEAFRPQATVDANELGEALDEPWLIRGPLQRSADERSNRGRDSGDAPDAA